MKLYKYTFGEWESYGPAMDDADAYERRTAIDPQFHYVPVTIEEVKLEGYEITVSPIEKTAEPTREAMKTELNARGISFFKGAPDEKLLELLQTVPQIDRTDKPWWKSENI